MAITKRRISKRNKIKRKYSTKKITKTRHSRKRVFSKKRRKTNKKKKRGGGTKRGGTKRHFGSISDEKSDEKSDENFLSADWFEEALKEIPSSAKKQKNDAPEPNANVSVLLITTHGGVTEYIETSPIKFKKINAVPLGCPNYLSDLKSHNLAEEILNLIKNYSSDIDTLTSEIQEHMCGITNITCKKLQRKRNPTERNKIYLQQVGHNIIQEFEEGDEYLDSLLATFNEHLLKHNKMNTPYYNAITLFHDNKQINVFNEILAERSQRNSARLNLHRKNELMLSDVLEYLKRKFGIMNLIIVDLSCSTIEGNIEDYEGYKYGGN